MVKVGPLSGEIAPLVGQELIVDYVVKTFLKSQRWKVRALF